MFWRRKDQYKYVRYDRKDEEYFGCQEVVHAEWEYINKRRKNQNAADTNNQQSKADTKSDEKDQLFLTAWNLALSRVKDKEQSGEQSTRPPDKLCGIALSGGGIRSASFCLGVLQALAFAGWLKKLDYISTVSGGGYIGGSLSWLLHKKWEGPRGDKIPYGLDKKNFPYGTYPMAGMKYDESPNGGGNKTSLNVYKGRMLMYLRQHACYLTPGDGINFMSLVAVVLRNTLFSLFVYGGLLVVLFTMLWHYLFDPVAVRLGIKQIDWLLSNANFAQDIAILASVLYLLAAMLYVALTLLPKKVNTGYRLRFFYERWMGRVLTLVIVFTVIGFVPTAYNSVQNAFSSSNSKQEAATMIKLSGHSDKWGAVTLEGELKQSEERQPDQSKDKGSVQNLFEKIKRISGAMETLVGGLSTMLAAIVSLLAFGQEGKMKKTIPTGILVAVASFFLIFGLLLITYSLAQAFQFVAEKWWAHWLDFLPDSSRAYYAWGGVVFLVFLIMRLNNLNYLSIHRYYRDRLMETFTPDLPDAIDVNGPLPGAAKLADSTCLNNILNEKVGMPYHIINTNIVLVSSKIPKFRGRGGDNFILTPKYCGSNATGWCETQNKSPYEDMTLPTAIAISGAAVNSNTGSGGNGMTRSPWFSFLMGFFNIRLGYWADNPTSQRERLRRIARALDRPIKARPWQEGEETLSYILRSVRHGLFVLWRWPLNRLYVLAQCLLTQPWCVGSNKPNALFPGLFEIFLRRNLDENSRMIQLSDGGHFENLGLYELVRRRLKLIIVCDGTADPHFKFDDLANAIEKVRTDFGAIIDLNCEDMESLTQEGKAEASTEADKHVAYAKQGYLIGEITYSDDSKGTLIYLKAAMFKELPADIYGYQKLHKEFPHQPTSDQFFDERQFEAYRELGFKLAHEMMLAM